MKGNIFHNGHHSTHLLIQQHLTQLGRASKMLKVGFEGQMQLLREYLDRTFNNGHVHSNMIYSHFGKSGRPKVFLKYEAERKFLFD